jgi:hypothetical protein
MVNKKEKNTFTKEQNEFIELIKKGRKDPVFFAYNLLGVELHDAQKLWLWMTTKTQMDQAYEMGLKLHDDNRDLWKDRETFDRLVVNYDFLKKNFLLNVY